MSSKVVYVFVDELGLGAFGLKATMLPATNRSAYQPAAVIHPKIRYFASQFTAFSASSSRHIISDAPLNYCATLIPGFRVTVIYSGR